MTRDRNPQARQMADESMLRNLAAQAEALWPQERPVLERHELPADARVLDVGCGPGEAVRRFAEVLPGASFVGVDVHAPHVELARERCAHLGARVRFEVGDAFELAHEDASFDLVVCRHLLQAIPEPERALEEMVRVARSGGTLHVVAEDYAMLHFDTDDGGVDVDRFFLDGPCEYARRTGSDLRSGRGVPRMLHALGLEDVRVDLALLDTERVPRPTLATIFRAWRDGYAEDIAANSNLSREEVQAAFAAMQSCLADETRYAVWQLPIVSGRKP